LADFQGSRPAVFIAPPFAAGRDIAGLVEMGAISKVPGTATRNARYAIVLPDPVPARLGMMALPKENRPTR